jgi:DnaJ-class molecular chaperone
VLKGRGIGTPDSKKRGNMFVVFKVVVPTNLTKEQVEWMRLFGKDEIVTPQPYVNSQFTSSIQNLKTVWERLKEKTWPWK